MIFNSATMHPANWRVQWNGATLVCRIISGLLAQGLHDQVFEKVVIVLRGLGMVEHVAATLERLATGQCDEN